MRPSFTAGLFHVIASLALVGPARAVIIDVTSRQAVGDGATVNTAAIQKAIDECSAQGGGSVHFPAGRFVTGTLQLKDKVHLQLDAGAVLLGSPQASDYRNVDPFTTGTGAEMGDALIVAVDARQVGIDGPGAIDGQGAALKANQNPYVRRPFLIRWVRCSEVSVQNVQLTHSGAWTMHFFQCKHVAVDQVGIQSRGLSNNDGIDIDSCQGVRISECDISTGDDAICLKATSPEPCRDISISNCRLSSDCAALKLGTETLGDFAQIRVQHCAIRNAKLGGIKLFSVDGARVSDAVFSDLTMEDVTVPIMLRLGARLKTFRAGDTPRTTGTIRDITFRNIRVIRAQQIGVLISGVPDHCIEQVAFENIDLQLAAPGPAKAAPKELAENEAAYPEIRMFGPVLPANGMYVRHVRAIRFSQVKLTVAEGSVPPASIFVDVEGVEPAGFGK